MFDPQKFMTNPLFLGGAALLSGEGMGSAMQGMRVGQMAQQQQREQEEAEKRRQQFLGLLNSPEIMANKSINPQMLMAMGPEAGLKHLADSMDPVQLLQRRQMEENLALMPLKRRQMERELAQPVGGSSEDPAVIREMKAVERMTPEQRDLYWRVKRADPLDRTYANMYGQQVLQGGNVDAAKNISQLRDVQTRLESGKENLTGPMLGMVPESIKSFTNPDAVAVQDQVEEVVQRNLREILGAQFTQKEGDRLIARAFNPRLEEKENAKRLARLNTAMEEALKAKQAAAAYYQENRTMRGFQGKTEWSVADFEKAMEGNTDTQLPTISDPSQARGLPSGTRFKTPDGRVMEVP